MIDLDQELDDFEEYVGLGLEKLFQAAKEKDEFAYIFALLGLNSGSEDQGWQPIYETFMILRDFTEISHAPFSSHTKMRLSLVVYCQITEASYPYHILYNMLLAAEGATPPKVFNFLDKYRGSTPPAVKEKVKIISKKALSLEHIQIKEFLDTIFKTDIRNAVSHADYILYKEHLRLKHRGDKIIVFQFNELTILINKAVIFFEKLFQKLDEHKFSYSEGYIIKDRKNSAGGNLSNILLKVVPKRGVVGFEVSDPLPIW